MNEHWKIDVNNWIVPRFGVSSSSSFSVSDLLPNKRSMLLVPKIIASPYYS